MDHVDPARPSQESAQTQPARVVEGRSSPEVVAFGPQGPEPAGWTRSEARPIQRRRASGATSEGGGASSPGAPLPAAVRSQMETSFGADFSGVRTHEGAAAPRLGAVAFTQGQDIHFAPGRLQPDSGAGRELLGHELAHVVQQGAGRVSVPQGKDAPINADAGLEAEADRAGAAAARGERAVVRGSARGLQRKEGGEGGEPPPDEEEEAPPDPMEKKGIHWPAMTQRYYDYLATVAAFDGKQGLWRFFDDLHPGPKATLMGQLVAAGVIPKDAKGNYQPGRGDRFKRAMGIDRISWDRFADMTRAYKAKV